MREWALRPNRGVSLVCALFVVALLIIQVGRLSRYNMVPFTFAEANVADAAPHDPVVGQIPSWLLEYVRWRSPSRYLVYTCTETKQCGGLGDRVRGIVATFALAVALNRTFLLHSDIPIGLERVFAPNRLDWLTDAKAKDLPSAPIFIYGGGPNATLETHLLSLNRTSVFVWRVRWRLLMVSCPAGDPVFADDVPVIRANVNRPIWSRILASPAYRNTMDGWGGPSRLDRQQEELFAAWVWALLFTPSPLLTETVAAKRRTLGIADNAEYIAMHFRHGGSWGDPIRHETDAIGRFATCADSMAAVLGGRAASPLPSVIISDSNEVKRAYKAKYPDVRYDSMPLAHIDVAVKGAPVDEAAIVNLFADFYLIQQSTCAVISRSGFSEWPTILSRNLTTGARCFASFQGDCSAEAIRRSLQTFVPAVDCNSL